MTRFIHLANGHAAMSDTFYVVWMHRAGRVTAVLAMADRESCERYAAYKNRRQHASWFEVRAA